MNAHVTRAGARPQIAIIGAGVIGMAIGWRLAAAGCAVDVFDRGEAGRAASWASAGMLAAGVETESGEEGLWPLTSRSQALWPDFARELEAYTGLPMGYRDEGTLAVALTRDDVEALRFNYDLQRTVGIDLEWLTGAQAREREPYLHAGTVAAVYSHRDHQVDNRCLVPALKAALLKAGGRLHENAEITAIEIEGGRAVGVRRGDTLHRADTVVLAAGAWSRGLPGLPEAVRPPVRPIRGQMVILRMDPAQPILRHVLWAPRAYLVPRADGRLLVGATTEERGFEAVLTAGGVFGLLEGAWRAIPTIEELRIDELVVGFRPGSRDDAPMLGPTAVDGLVMATGHHRNGVLLTPITADAIRDFILTGALMDVVQAFTLDRFQRPPKEKTT